MYVLDGLSDGRWAVKDQENGEIHLISNSYRIADKTKRRLNGEPSAEDLTTCYRFDACGATAFLVCSKCHEEIRDGEFYYVRGGKIVCPAHVIIGVPVA